MGKSNIYPTKGYIREDDDNDLAIKFSYSPTTGNIFKYGIKIDGTPEKHGYLKIFVGLQDGAYRRVYKHRLAWYLHYKVWPAKILDHINHDPSDNRIDNLRECDRKQNNANSRKPNTNTSGFKGVCLTTNGKRYRAYIRHGNRQVNLGRYDNVEAAAAAYINAAIKYRGDFACGG